MVSSSDQIRIEQDSLGKVNVPVSALYGAQTQRAVDNFPISGYQLSRSMIQALGQVKHEAAGVNAALGFLTREQSALIQQVCVEIIDGAWDEQFPVDIFQTGSGTSSNMNTNEVISHRAGQINREIEVHPNDHVNFGQSSNDVFPTASRIAAYHDASSNFLPALQYLHDALQSKGEQYAKVVRTGRTHLMDAMPVTFGQLFSGYTRQLSLGMKRVQSALKQVAELPLGGTAVGTGINTHPEFAGKVVSGLGKLTGFPLIEADNYFEAQSTVDALVELSGQIKTVAVSLMKIVNDLRWMNSGPNSGLGEIQLPSVQPGSSIMPGKVNPVIEESAAMVCAQVIGFDAAVTAGGLSGNFELNVMQPMVITNVLESMRLLGNAARNLADKSINGLVVREEHIRQLIDKNPILVTALNPLVGYDLAARIAKKAFAENRPLKSVALEMTDLSEAELNKALDPYALTRGGLM